MSTPGAGILDQQLTTADELLSVLSNAAVTGQELVIAAELEKLASRIAGLRLEMLAAASAQESEGNKVIPVADQIHADNRCTRKAARADVRLAQALADHFQIIGAAWRSGEISQAQARAIVAGLGDLPSWIGLADLEQAQHTLVGFAADFDPDALRQLARRMVEVVAPESADAALAERTEREARLSFQRRFLRLTPDHHGSMLISGQLPIADGELLRAQLDALTPSAASYRDCDEVPSPAARRADALVRLTSLAAASGTLPARGGDRPQVIMTMSLDALLGGLGPAALFDSGEQLSPAQARRIACDADLIPAVLGSDSRPLDVGRTQRLFTGPVRSALVLRDQGCAFPGCDATPGQCDAHHIQPWYLGGTTSLDNGVLLCRFHHQMVEPDPLRAAEHDWQIHLDQAARPVFVPPRQVDLLRRPRQHQRYRLRDPLPLSSPERGSSAEPPPRGLPWAAGWC